MTTIELRVATASMGAHFQKILDISQEIKVLKPQNPCSRVGATYIYLHNSVCFKTNSDQIEKGHKIDAKINTQMVEQSIEQTSKQ